MNRRPYGETMRRRIVFSVAVLIAVLATPSTTTPPEFEDDAEAVRWYRLAAEQGRASAQFNLGGMYATGEGVLKDSVLAHMWSNIAGANGNASARKLRDSLERDMTRAEISRAIPELRAVSNLPALANDWDAAAWLGDPERCVAWLLRERLPA